MTAQPIAKTTAPNSKDLNLKGFKVHEIDSPVSTTHSQGRRDFYKIVLTAARKTIIYSDQTIETKNHFLFFSNPYVPHTVVHHPTTRKAHVCLFTEAFIAGRERKEILRRSPLFQFGGVPVIPLNAAQAAFMTGIFQEMISVYHSDYEDKKGLLATCVELILREALRIQPPQQSPHHNNAAGRITSRFMDLLERQFPIESAADPLKLRTAQDFAARLNVHINYLNRVVKETTGKPTSAHISERIVAEAKAMLQHTDLSIAEIAYGLGFEYTTYFNNYFKRITGVNPKSFRNA